MTQKSSPFRSLTQAFDVVRLLGPLLPRVASKDRPLADQLRRAAQSAALNLAESRGHRGGNERLCRERALGSTYEVMACLEIARSWGYLPTAAADEALRESDRLAGMTYRLLHPKR